MATLEPDKGRTRGRQQEATAYCCAGRVDGLRGSGVHTAGMNELVSHAGMFEQEFEKAIADPMVQGAEDLLGKGSTG